MTPDDRTYRHNDEAGNFIGWRVEVFSDKFNSSSRLATDDEIAKAVAAEVRAAQIAAFTAELDGDSEIVKPKKAK